MLMLLYLTIRDTFYLFNCYLPYGTCQCRPILHRNRKYCPMFSSPQICIVIPVINFIAAENAEYDEWIEQFCRWDVTAEHVSHTMTFKDLTYATHNLFFRSSLHST